MVLCDKLASILPYPVSLLHLIKAESCQLSPHLSCTRKRLKLS